METREQGDKKRGDKVGKGTKGQGDKVSLGKVTRG